ncbi:MAG: PAS domain-containing protein, partial [Candidatus Limnocylindrales bacterium]
MSDDRTPLGDVFIPLALLEQSPGAVIAADADGLIRYTNPATEALFGYPTGSLIGTSIEP